MKGIIPDHAGYVHRYEAYRVNKNAAEQAAKDGKPIQAFRVEENGDMLVLTDEARKQMELDRQGYYALIEQKLNEENAEKAKEGAEKMASEQMKIMTVFRNMCKGDIVPPSDEKKLMEFDDKMYTMAKQAQTMAQMMERCEKNKHKSLWEDEEKAEENPSVDPAASQAEFSDAQSEAVVEVEAPAEAVAEGGE